jgi:hypothetical protein
MSLEETFFSGALTAGAILTGFCGTFLSFRIQREANYYRQPVVDFATETAKDVHVGLSHFSTSFLILIVATIVTMLFGTVLPLLALSGLLGNLITTKFVCSGILSGLALLGGYFWIELLHYNILSNRLLHDSAEWGGESLAAVISLLMTAIIFAVIEFAF